MAILISIFISSIVISRVNSEKLTTNENVDRLNTCGNYDQTEGSHIYHWVTMNRDGDNLQNSQMASLISSRHVLTSSFLLNDASEEWGGLMERIENELEASDDSESIEVEVDEYKDRIKFWYGKQFMKISRALIIDVKNVKYFKKAGALMILELEKDIDTFIPCFDCEQVKLGDEFIYYLVDNNKVFVKTIRMTITGYAAPLFSVEGNLPYVRGALAIKFVNEKWILLGMGIMGSFGTDHFSVFFSFRLFCNSICRGTGICPAREVLIPPSPTDPTTTTEKTTPSSSTSTSEITFPTTDVSTSETNVSRPTTGSEIMTTLRTLNSNSTEIPSSPHPRTRKPKNREMYYDDLDDLDDDEESEKTSDSAGSLFVDADFFNGSHRHLLLSQLIFCVIIFRRFCV